MAIRVHIDFEVKSSRHDSAKVLRTKDGNCIVAMVTVYVMVPPYYQWDENNTMERCGFLKLIIHSQAI